MSRPTLTKKSLTIKSITAAFYDSQHTKKHESNIKELKQLYNGSDLKDFLADFIHCLKISFTHPEASLFVENSLNFAAKFAASLTINLDEDQTCPFLNGILQFLFENHGCENYIVRLRVCRFINRLFDNMGQEAYLDEEIYNIIRTCMMERLQDKVAKVRAEAVYALHRLQDPSDPSCRITSVFLYHMKCDPSHEVRCAVVNMISVNKKTLPFVLNRVHDIKDVVRRAAYNALMKLAVQRFSIRQRQVILESGLNDKFAMVRNFIAERMLPSWLDAYNSDYVEFLQSLNVESFTDVSMIALKQLFKNEHTIPLASIGIEDKLIPYSKLSSETAFFWRALVEYLKPTDDSSEKKIKSFDNVLPDLTPFVQYVRYYFFPPNRAARENAPTEFVLVQLLYITKIYDFSDEVGRLSLKDLCMTLLLSSRVGPTSTKVIAQLLPYVIPDINIRLSFMVEIVSELREPLSPLNATFMDESEALQAEKAALEFELFQLINIHHDEENDIEQFAKINKTKLCIRMVESKQDSLQNLVETHDEDGRSSKNDAMTLIKCLTFITSIIEAKDITEMNPILYSLLQNFVVPVFETQTENNETVHQLALQALGILCTLDLELAKEKFLMICFQIANESLSATSLKVIFDLLLFHGLDVFNIEEPEGNFINIEMLSGTTRPNANLIYLLISLLSSQMPLMRITTLQGLCKLIYSKRICNPYLITRLFILWFSHELDNDAQIKQTLTVFFNLYATNCPSAPGMLLDCFIPTLKAFSEEGYIETEGKTNINGVAKLIVNLTRPNINKYCTKNNTHNLLAIKICKVFLEGSEDLEIHLLIKTLLDLDLNFNIQEEIENIKTDVQKIKMLLEKFKDKGHLKLLTKLEMMLEINQHNVNNSVSTVQNTFPDNELSISTSKFTTHNQSNGFKVNTKKGVNSLSSSEIDDISEVDSYEPSPYAEVMRDRNAEGIVIPESSDSENELVDGVEAIVVAETP